jgi:hypothetical protein
VIRDVAGQALLVPASREREDEDEEDEDNRQLLVLARTDESERGSEGVRE